MFQHIEHFTRYHGLPSYQGQKEISKSFALMELILLFTTHVRNKTHIHKAIKECYATVDNV